VSNFTLLIFVAWIPLLYVARLTKKRIHFFLYSLLTTISWNAFTTWWIWNSTDVGAVAAILANSLLMTLPWWGYHIFKKRYGANTGYVSLVVFWMMFEYLHLNWQLSWPWLTLGNVFALHPPWVQWYSWTGVDGGTLWILLVNIFLFELIVKIRRKQLEVVRVLVTSLVIALPLIVSYFIQINLPAETPDPHGANVVIVQPNVDPYNEKFDAADVSNQLDTLITLSEQKIDSNTRLVLWPETALSAGVLQNELEEIPVYRPVFDFVKRHPQIMLETGVETFKTYGAVKATKTAQYDENNHLYYDAFNSAVAIKYGAPLQFYNKNKLVPGVETLPDFLLWMAPVFEKFGGTAGGFGRSKESAVFSENANPYITAPIICYESIYGGYITAYVRKGANLLTIMTNDGWWGNTPGYRQHFEYARLRAIETRRWVARSANTGISGVIDCNGDVIKTLPWDEAASIKAAIPAATGDTFYGRFGDWLFKIATFFGMLLIVYHVYVKVKKKIKPQENRV
jgi:apolipoprotein N-acyltransferase